MFNIIYFNILIRFTRLARHILQLDILHLNVRVSHALVSIKIKGSLERAYTLNCNT